MKVDERAESPAPKRVRQPHRVGTRMVLLAGFGGLLAVMGAVGVDSVRALGAIQASNRDIHRHYIQRERTLEQIRSALYLSGTVVRDYILLDPGQSATETLRSELKAIKAEMDEALKSYSRSLRPEEMAPYRDLTAGLDAYWQILNPIFEWDAEEKRERGYWFLRRELFPRRATVLELARDIATVNEQTLREGEERVAEVFAGFRRRLLIMTGSGMGLGLLVAVFSIWYILRLERDADLRYQESLRAQRELKELSARLLDAQEQERRAISRELHDEVGQSLTALLVDAGNLAASPGADGAFRQRLEGIKKLAENSVNVVRNMSLLLRPSMLDDLGLVPALEWQAREVSKRTGMLVEVVEENVSDQLPEEHKTCVYRIVQGALHNCFRHAQARTVRIFVRQERERLLLEIQDDGRGFDARRVRGVGLLGMAERVNRLGGAFKIESEPGRGALLHVELPLAGQPVQAETVAS